MESGCGNAQEQFFFLVNLLLSVIILFKDWTENENTTTTILTYLYVLNENCIPSVFDFLT